MSGVLRLSFGFALRDVFGFLGSIPLHASLPASSLVLALDVCGRCGKVPGAAEVPRLLIDSILIPSGFVPRHYHKLTGSDLILKRL